MDADQDLRYRFRTSFGTVNGRMAVIYEIYRNDVLVRTTVVYIDEIDSETEETGGRAD
jgi:hypothetical protein